MSRLSVLIHRYEQSQVVHGVVSYLEHVDISGEEKKAIATTVLRALHVSTGGTWDSMLENVISGAIEYVLAGIRDAANTWDKANKPVPTPAEPPTTTQMYQTTYTGEVYADQQLKDIGYVVADSVWQNTNSAVWFVQQGAGVGLPGVTLLRRIE